MRAVIVTTEFRGVFFGYIDDSQDVFAQHITLHNCRNCLYWPNQTGGFGGLATYGALPEARIGARVQTIHLRGVTAVIECTKEAVLTWEAAPVCGQT